MNWGLPVKPTDRPRCVSCPPSLVIAKPRKGLWQSVSPVQTPVPRPSSPVNLWGISRGPQPPGRWGGFPKGTAFGIGSLWRFLSPISFPLKEMGSRRSVKSPRPNSRLSSPLRRAIVRVSADSPLASAFRSAVPSPPAGNFLCSPKESYQRNALKGTCAGAVPLRIPPRLPRGLRPPLDPPGAYGGREALDGSRIKV